MPSPLKSIFSCFRPSGQAEEPVRRSPASRAESETSSPRASGVLEGLTPRNRLSDGERQLGGYLLARQTVGRPVEGADFDRLRRANETVMEARKALRRGRGNVREDIRDSNGESSVRANAARDVATHLESTSEFSSDVCHTAVAMAVQSGNCAEHADVAAFLHAPHLGEGEHVYAVGSTVVDHSWAEWHGQSSDRGDHIVMDPWAKGPAIFADDGAFSANQHEIATRHHYDRETGAHAHAQMQKLQQKQDRQMQKRLQRSMKKHGPDFRFPESRLWDTTPVVSAELAAQVPRRMFQQPNPARFDPPGELAAQQWTEPVFMDELWMAPLRQQIHATGTARMLGADNVQDIAESAERIAHVAADLRRYPVASHPAQYESDEY